MSWPFEQLFANYETLRGAETALTGLVFIGLLLWIQRVGGARSIRKWLTDIHGPQSAEAKKLIRKGLDLTKTATTASEEECVDALVEGLDQWRLRSNKLRARARSIDTCRWCVIGMLASVVGAWISDVLTVGKSTIAMGLMVAWAIATVVLLIYLVPLLRLVIEHGEPEPIKGPGPNTQSVPEDASGPVRNA